MTRTRETILLAFLKVLRVMKAAFSNEDKRMSVWSDDVKTMEEVEKFLSTKIWMPMADNVFPWPYREVLVAAFAKDDPAVTEIFQCRCGEHGAYFARGNMCSLIESGWIPFAFCDDKVPDRQDPAFPPMWHDYLTDPEINHG